MMIDQDDHDLLSSSSLFHGAKQRAVIAVVADEDIPPVDDLTLRTQEEPYWLRERENVAKTLSRMIMVQSTGREFLTSENISSTIDVTGTGGEIFLGRFFFASTNSDVAAMKLDFEVAGYICHRLDKELLLCKAFQKALPVFKAEEKVISVFSNVNVRAENVPLLLRVSKYTRLLTFSKEAFILFKTEAERDLMTKSHEEVIFDRDHLRFFKLRPPQSPHLRNIPENVKTRPNCSTILVLTPLFMDKKVKNFDPKL